MTCLERIANEMDVVGSCREGRRPERDKPLVHTTARLAIGECEEVGPRPPEEELKSDPPEEIAARKYFSQRLDLPRAWTWHLMTEAIKTSSEVIRGHQRSSDLPHTRGRRRGRRTSDASGSPSRAHDDAKPAGASSSSLFGSSSSSGSNKIH